MFDFLNKLKKQKVWFCLVLYFFDLIDAADESRLKYPDSFLLICHEIENKHTYSPE